MRSQLPLFYKQINVKGDLVVSEGHFEATAGPVYIEIPMMLSSESGEGKHTDLNEQGLHLAFSIAQYLKSISTEGAALSEMTFWGTTAPGTGEPVRRIDFTADL
jgi:hypothetical protein